MTFVPSTPRTLEGRRQDDMYELIRALYAVREPADDDEELTGKLREPRSDQSTFRDQFALRPAIQRANYSSNMKLQRSPGKTRLRNDQLCEEDVELWSLITV